MRRVLFLVVTVFLSFQLQAQTNVETRLVYADTTSYPFSSEWQYLTTDIFLFNGPQFSKLINELNFSVRGRRNTSSTEMLEALYITAQLKNLKIFGNNDMVYPLYNFQINRDRDKKYQTFVSDNIDKVTIIDNLPLYNAGNNIDAEIQVKALTQNDRDQVLGVIGAQLRNLARLDMTSIANSLIGEMGAFLEAGARKKEYHFSTTIRLFEQKNFDKRLHSVKVYVMATQNSQPITMNSLRLQEYIKTTEITELQKDMVQGLIGYEDYPYIVVANYMSLYHMEDITGDEVNQANIDKRKVRVENNYNNKLISEDTYRQEKDFINFITIFSGMKSSLEMYSLNFKMGNVDAAVQGLSNITQQYRNLLKSYEETVFKNKGNTTFNNVFDSQYQSILGYASIYLEADQNLRSTKTLVKTITDAEKNGLPASNAELEDCLRNMSFANNFKKEFLEKTPEGQTINSLVTLAERRLNQNIFLPAINKLRSTPATEQNQNAPVVLKDMISNTNCNSCRDEALVAIKDFYVRYDENQKTEALKNRAILVRDAEARLFTYIEKSDLVGRNFPLLYPDTTSLSAGLIWTRYKELKRDVQNLSDFLKIRVDDKPFSVVANSNELLKEQVSTIEEDLKALNELKPELLDPNFKPVVKLQEPVVVPDTVKTEPPFSTMEVIATDSVNNVVVSADSVINRIPLQIR